MIYLDIFSIQKTDELENKSIIWCKVSEARLNRKSSDCSAWSALERICKCEHFHNKIHNIRVDEWSENGWPRFFCCLAEFGDHIAEKNLIFDRNDEFSRWNILDVSSEKFPSASLMASMTRTSSPVSLKFWTTLGSFMHVPIHRRA